MNEYSSSGLRGKNLIIKIACINGRMKRRRAEALVFFVGCVNVASMCWMAHASELALRILFSTDES